MQNPIYVYIIFWLSMLMPSTQLTNFDASQEDAWQDLIDANLSEWDIYLGVPHQSSGIAGYEEVSTLKAIQTGKALGLGNKKNVFSVVKVNDEEVLKITGEIFGALVSKNEYENYHLKFQFKWGSKKWPPRIKSLRNNGLLYHSIGEFGAGLWNTWMSSLEFEVEEKNFGDFITINDAYVRAKSPAVLKRDSNYYFQPDAALVSFNWENEPTGRCFKSIDKEKPRGEWNQLELICYGNTSIHIVNGEVVMAVYEPEFFNGVNWIPMSKGKLQIQSEAAEAYFKNILIRPIKSLDPMYKSYLR